LMRSSGVIATSLLRIVGDAAVDERHLLVRVATNIMLVRYHDDGAPVGVQFGEQLQDCGSGRLVQITGRLVSHQDRRIVGQRSGNGRPLLLPARQGGGHLVGLICDTNALQEVQGLGTAFGRRDDLHEIHR